MGNTEIWQRLAKTDPAHTKEFQRAGGFKGKAIKPIYTELKMTEEFGPCGIGWGINKPEFTLLPTGDEVLVYCTVSVWYELDGKRGELTGVGGDVAVKKFASGKVVADDEAFKKAFTDAIGNAMKHLGMSADVHMGQHEDSKYVTALKKELEDKAAGPEDRSNQQICDDFLDLVRDITDRDEYIEAWNSQKTALKRIQRNEKVVYDRFIMDLPKIIGPKSFNEAKEPAEEPPPAEPRDEASPSTIAARNLLKALKAAPHMTAFNTALAQAGFLSLGEDGFVLKAESNLAAIRDAEPDVYRKLEAETMKVRALLETKAAA